MELSLVIIIAAVAGFWWWSREHERTSNAVKAYAFAIGSRREKLPDAEADEAEADRLQFISWSLIRSLTMKRADWKGEADLMKTTWRDVCASIYDERVLHSAGLYPHHPGYSETVAAVEALKRKLSGSRKISGWVP